MPTLRTLGINNWPDPPGGYSQTEDMGEEELYDFNFKAYKHNLTFLATEIAQLRQNALECADLTIIRFGLFEQITDEFNWGFGFSPAWFVKTRLYVMGGRQVTKMELLDPCSYMDLEHERDDSDIDMWAHHVGQFEAKAEWR
ncbi:MAG: hypothetical protein Q9226_005143, partial [Calogaya cf. arnoldii]